MSTDNEWAPKPIGDGPEVAPTELLGDTVFDSRIFDSLYRIAGTMANSSLVPDSFKGVMKQGKITEEYPLEKVVANCFLVVEQAFRWKISPFAAIGCASVIYGRLMWEGKLVHAVIEKQLGIRLKYEYNNKGGNDFGVTVTGTLQGESEPRSLSGTVGQWRTAGDNSPWMREADHPRQLRYRGAREWARAFAPGVLLGVMSDDEAVDLDRMRNVTETEGTTRAEIIDPFPRKTIADSAGTGEATETPKQEASQPSREAVGSQGETPMILAKIGDVQVTNGKKGERPWTRFRSEISADGDVFSVATFDKKIGEEMQTLAGKMALVDYEETDRGIKLTAIKEANQDEGGLV